ncbi:patatin-like phospholipase family protein, partial [Aquipuribacter sp. SD81]|uniref:patatin-like phospholipase family protein n=1 Tax=Aquipuribacter sp. SD81 TaxID=3127703 RepID=UPI00301AF7C2
GARDGAAAARRAPRRALRRARGGHSWGLVLGGGGVLGGAWMAGALSAYEAASGRDCRDADVIIGTSVGAFAAALLGAGASVADWCAHQEGRRVRQGPMAGLAWDYDVDSGGAHPPRPGHRPGSPGLVVGNVRRLRRVPPAALFSALVPEGRGSPARIGETVDGLLGGRDWVPRRGVRAVALDYDTGHRTVFAGPTDQPEADRHRRHTVRGARLADAVMASCAIPGWYAPVTIGEHRYVDGGTWSSTNVDLVAADHLDEVVVVAPMVCFAPDRPRTFAQIVDRQWREATTARCLREVRAAHAAGTEVTVLGPSAEDLAVLGTNVMDPQHRLRVLRTSLRTSAEALTDPEPLGLPADPPVPAVR